MLPLKTILHPTDFSKHSQHAFRLACSVAKDYGAALIVVHVDKPPDVNLYEGGVPILLPAGQYDPELEKELRRVVPPAGYNLRIQHRLEMGDPADEILRVAEEAKCDLIVMGTHGRSGLGRLLMGSVAERVLRKASCPVL